MRFVFFLTCVAITLIMFLLFRGIKTLRLRLPFRRRLEVINRAANEAVLSALLLLRRG